VWGEEFLSSIPGGIPFLGSIPGGDEALWFYFRACPFTPSLPGALVGGDIEVSVFKVVKLKS